MRQILLLPAGREIDNPVHAESDQHASEESRKLVRIPQLIGLLAAAGSVVVLFIALWLPDVFGAGGDDDEQTSAIGFRLTQEAEERSARATSDVSLSDLAPRATESATVEPTSTAAQPTAQSSATIAPSTTPSPTPLPQCTGECVKVGVAMPEFPGDFEAIVEFGELSGRMPDMVMFFQAWGDEDREFKDWLPELADMGVSPLITWEPWNRDEFIEQSVYTQEAILAGQHDAYIDRWAQQAAAFEETIYLRFAHEMNTPEGKVYWYPWQGDPETYKAVWRHVHDRFEAAGADNVEWVWSVAWLNDDAELYYPGDEYVDWVAMTVLNFGEGKPDSSWRTFYELYSLQHSRAISYGKPIMISELATAEQGGDKGQWIADIGDDLANHFPEIGAIVWLNYPTAREFEEINWRVNSSPGALEGWWDLMHHPYITNE